MNRFDTYQPIKFDVPMFTPDFAALEALQTQKQKTLDDFRNQTDLIASSIKDDPYDPTVKEKKIKDIMASKDAIVNEMLRNPTKGSQLLNQYQSTLKNDILFGDINKVNARATDYEQKIADLKTQPLWNDPIWRKGALEEIKNSYGDFQTAEGFGKTKGDDFAHTFYTVPERDAILNSYTDKVAHEMYDSELRKHPEMENKLSFDTFYSQLKTDELSYKRLLEAALPQALADTRLQDFYETEGKLRGLGEGQGKVELKRNPDGSLNMESGHPVIDDKSLFGQALHGTLNEKTYKNTGVSYIKGSNDRLKDEINFGQQQTLQKQQFAHADAQEARRMAFEREKMNNELMLKAKIADEEKKKKISEGIQVQKSPERLLDIPSTQIAKNRENVITSKVNLENERKSLLKEFMANGNKFSTNEDAIRYNQLNKQIEAKDRQIENYDEELNKVASNSGLVKQVFGDTDVQSADVIGAGYSPQAILMRGSGLYDLFNFNDYTLGEVNKEAAKKGVNIMDDMMQGFVSGKDWKDFKKTSKAYKALEGSGGDNFGIGNSIYDIYTTGLAKFKAGHYDKGFAASTSGLLLAPPEDTKEGKTYYEAGYNGMRNGTIKDESGLTIAEKAANERGVEPNKIILVSSGEGGNKTEYKIEGGKPQSGYYNVYYKVEGDKKVYHTEGWAKNDYANNSAFQDIHTKFAYNAYDNQGNLEDNPYADAIIARNIEDNPEMLGDLASIQEMNKPGESVKLNATILTRNGELNLADKNFNITLDGSGRYRIHYGEDMEFKDSYTSPTAAYSAIVKLVNYPTK